MGFDLPGSIPRLSSKGSRKTCTKPLFPIDPNNEKPVMASLTFYL
jgi:hypothetical protein